MRYTTLQFRIKDSTTGKHLTKMAGAVNYVWNYCNEVNQERWKKFNKTFSHFDLTSLTAGCSAELGLHSQTVQIICKEFATRAKQFKTVRLRWRSKKRSLGWIPFSKVGIQVKGDTVIYKGHKFRLWLSHPVEGVVQYGSFSQDAKGHWYVNLTIEEGDKGRLPTGKEVGVDLGLKTIATLSDGTQLDRDNLTRTYAAQLATAQQAKKKRRVRAIHAKIKQQRKDWNHKATTRLVRDYDRIIVGNVSSSKLIKTRLAKSVSDASWSTFKTMLVYKAAALGVEVKEVSESFSTVTCSHCGSRTGPKGQAELRVREWICSSCSTTHGRDVNAAINILLSVRGVERYQGSSLSSDNGKAPSTASSSCSTSVSV